MCESDASGTPSTTLGMTDMSMESDKDSIWYFTAEQLSNSPSRRHGIDSDQELSYRQFTAYLIQEIGQSLQVSQLCINTGIVYMHRFYAFHSFTHFHHNGIAAASLFLAAKVEEHPRRLEHVIKATNKCLNQPTSPITDAYYIEQAQELIFHENALLQTLGFDVAIDHPHTHVVKTCHLVKACKDLAQTSYFLASNSLHLTTMCLQYRPTVVACFCIYLACKWSRWEIPQSTEGKHWFQYVDRSVTMELLKKLTDEFLTIYEKSPTRLKAKLNSIKALAQGASNQVLNKDKRAPNQEWKMTDVIKTYHSSLNISDNNKGNMQSELYPTQSFSELQSHNVQTPVLLPPPQPQQQKQNQVRKTDMHSSQNRPLHSTSSTHRHSKLSFPAVDAIDHKTNHKQQPYSGSIVSRSESIPQMHQQMSSTNMPRSSVAASSGRSSIDTCRTEQSSGHQSGHAATSHTGHKLSQNQESNRMIFKDSSSRKTDQTKQASNKVFSGASIVASQSSGTNHISTTELNSKEELGHDTSRNLIHNQRNYSGNNGPSTIPQHGYHWAQLARQVNNGNNKHDQTKPISTQQQQHLLQSNSNMRNSGMVLNEDHPNVQFQSAQEMLSQNQSQQQPKQQVSSIFSPDWNEIMPHAMMETNDNGNKNSVPGHHDSLNLKVSSNKENPKGIERDRTAEIYLKKHKHRSGHMASEVPAQMPTQKQMKPSLLKKLESSSNVNEFIGINAGTPGSIKRLSKDAPFKQDDNILRDSKVRKLDISIMQYQETKCAADMNKLKVVTNIEPNPDLMRSVLKKSLCTTNVLIKSDPLNAPNLHPPAQLMQLSPMDISYKGSNIDSRSAQVSMNIEENIGSKVEKKKKKDKHKHKEKDKTKEIKERKKNKKDKDRNIELEHNPETNSEPVKINISKEKLEAGSGYGGEQVGFKIKIPKDRIYGDISGNTMNSHDIHTSNAVTNPTSALKIKISKDKLENYSSGSSHPISVSQLTTSGHSSSSIYQTSNTSLSSSNSSSSKKKDRGRDSDREKEKQRSSHDSGKSNGNLAGAAGPVTHLIPKTKSKSKAK